MLALRRPVAASGPLVGAYSGLSNRTRKIEKPRFGEIFLIFFRFPRDIDHHLGVVISNIQCGKNGLTSVTASVYYSYLALRQRISNGFVRRRRIQRTKGVIELERESSALVRVL